MPKYESTKKLLEMYFLPKKLPTSWCPGCGTGTIIGAMVRAIHRTGIPPHKFCLITGIGCYGGAGSYLDFTDVHALHGRALAIGTGLKIARRDTHVLALVGDGDACSIGGNHLIHAARRNINLTTVLINNHIFGMTGGQYSPTTGKGDLARTAPFGMKETPFDACKLVEGAGGTFIARITVYHVAQLIEYIVRGIRHKGFSLIEVESQCPTLYGRLNKKGGPSDMLRFQRDNSIWVDKAEKMSPDEIRGKLIIGILKDEKQPEYTEEYFAEFSAEITE
jgi:2-oxoglutarate ferredoxin oxidoreductase subunit beta